VSGLLSSFPLLTRAGESTCAQRSSRRVLLFWWPETQSRQSGYYLLFLTGVLFSTFHFVGVSQGSLSLDAWPFPFPIVHFAYQITGTTRRFRFALFGNGSRSLQRAKCQVSKDSVKPGHATLRSSGIGFSVSVEQFTGFLIRSPRLFSDCDCTVYTTAYGDIDGGVQVGLARPCEAKKVREYMRARRHGGGVLSLIAGAESAHAPRQKGEGF
jgi:hypothetical protein